MVWSTGCKYGYPCILRANYIAEILTQSGAKSADNVWPFAVHCSWSVSKLKPENHVRDLGGVTAGRRRQYQSQNEKLERFSKFFDPSKISIADLSKRPSEMQTKPRRGINYF
jgi:hypothetical protein